MSQRTRRFESVTMRKDVVIGGYVELVPGAWFAVRALPSSWHRWWLRVLLGWHFRVERP